jgi:hypothetical protein
MTESLFLFFDFNYIQIGKKFIFYQTFISVLKGYRFPDFARLPLWEM